jgi:hypothetical protein
LHGELRRDDRKIVTDEGAVVLVVLVVVVVSPHVGDDGAFSARSGSRGCVRCVREGLRLELALVGVSLVGPRFLRHTPRIAARVAKRVVAGLSAREGACHVHGSKQRRYPLCARDPRRRERGDRVLRRGGREETPPAGVEGDELARQLQRD